MEIEAGYNIYDDKDTCFVVEKDGGYWYAFKGASFANFTYDELSEGTNTTELTDSDTMSLSDDTFESESDLERAVNDEEVDAAYSEDSVVFLIGKEEAVPLLIKDIEFDTDGVAYICETIYGDEVDEIIREDDIGFYCASIEEAESKWENERTDKLVNYIKENNSFVKDFGYGTVEDYSNYLEENFSSDLKIEFLKEFTNYTEDPLDSYYNSDVLNRLTMDAANSVGIIDVNNEEFISKIMHQDEKTLAGKQKAYILEAIECVDGNDVDITDELTVKGKLQYLANDMKERAFYPQNVQRYKNDSKTIISEYIKGLPNEISIAYKNDNIDNIGKEWGVDLSDDNKIFEWRKSWFDKNAEVLLELMEENSVDVRGDNTVFEKKVSETSSPSIDECLQQIEEEETAKQNVKSPRL